MSFYMCISLKRLEMAFSESEHLMWLEFTGWVDVRPLTTHSILLTFKYHSTSIASYLLYR